VLCFGFGSVGIDFCGAPIGRGGKKMCTKTSCDVLTHKMTKVSMESFGGPSDDLVFIQVPPQGGNMNHQGTTSPRQSWRMHSTALICRCIWWRIERLKLQKLASTMESPELAAARDLQLGFKIGKDIMGHLHPVFCLFGLFLRSKDAPGDILEERLHALESRTDAPPAQAPAAATGPAS
jgi:hypothetical protein